MKRPWWIPGLLALFAAALVFYRPAAHTAALAQPQRQEPKLIALTFDDGPKPPYTDQLLEGLSRRGAKATFFLIGRQIPGNEDLVRRMEEEGHQVGIHTYDHVSLQGLSDGALSHQIRDTEALLRAALGHGGFWVRPPFGLTDGPLLARTEAPVLLWSVDPEDWKDGDVPRIVSAVKEAAGDGEIILMHDIFPSSVEAALEVVDALHREGYAFVTVSDLLAARGVEAKPGRVYRRAPP